MKSTLPTNWSWVKLGDVCEEVYKVKDFDRTGSFYYLDIGSVNNKTNQIESVKEYEWKNAPSRAKQIVKYNDILFSTVRTYLKNITKVPLIYDNQIASTGFCVIRPNKNQLNSDYIFYLTLADKFLEPLNALQVGSSYPAVRNGDVLKQTIPLPPLPEQKKIVEKIEELFSGLDSGVASLKKAKEQIKLYRQSVLVSAFNGKLIGNGDIDEKTGLPTDWRLVSLNEVCTKITDGTHKTPKYVSEGVEFLSVKDIYKDKLHFDECKYITLDEHRELIKRCKPERGDVLITKSGTIGRTAVVDTDKEFSLFVSVALLKNNKNTLNSKYLKYSLDNYINKTSIDQFIKGGLLKNFHIEDIKATRIAIPPLNQQVQVVEEIEKRFSEADNLEKAIEESLEKAETLRQSILKQAFEGKLVTNYFRSER